MVEIPHDISAEICVLGGMMLDPKGVSTAKKMLVVSDFFRPAHQVLFDTILRMDAPIDMVLLKNQLSGIGKFDEIGGSDYLQTVMEGVPSTTNQQFYCNIVRDKSVRRSLLQLSKQCEDKATDGAEDETSSHLTSIQQDIYQLFRRISGGASKEMSLHDAVELVAQEQEAAIDDETILAGVNTGVRGIDSCVHGFHPGELVVLAADTSVGKSAMAMQWAIHAANEGKRVLVVSAEMTPKELGQRAVQSQAQIPGNKLKTGCMDEQHWGQLNWYREESKKQQLHIVQSAPTVADIGLLARERASCWGGLDFIVIDYLQLMRATGHGDLRTQVSEITRDTKALAMDMGVPIVLLSQFERGGVKFNAMPTIHNLKESGSIEQDANIIILMYQNDKEGAVDNPFEAHPKHRHFPIWVQVAKNRGGERTKWSNDPNNNYGSDITLKFYPWLTRFED